MRTLPLDAHIVRHVLLNYRVDPAAIEPHLPHPLRPQLLDGWAVAGICLIALGPGRPRGHAAPAATRTENAAHRIAVEWRDRHGRHAGVYNARRDSDSVLHALAGGRFFPGLHHRAHFEVAEAEELAIGFEALDGPVGASVRVAPDRPFQPSVLFPTLENASDFFARGAADYSVTRDPLRLDGVSIATDEWHLEPLELLDARSTLFESPTMFPPRTVHLDSAFLMRDVRVQWRALPSMRVQPYVVELASVG